MNKPSLFVRRALMWIGAGCAAVPAFAYAQPPAVPLTIRWADTPPNQVVIELPTSDVPLVQSSSHFSGTIPASPAALSKVPVVARYGQRAVKLMLVVRRGTAALNFELPNPAPSFCHQSYVSAAERETHSRADALRAMLIAHHLLQLSTPHDCLPELRNRLLRARLLRNFELTRTSEFFDIVPEYRQAYAQAAGGSTEALAELARLDRDVLSVEVARIYRAQAVAQEEGDYESAYAMLADLQARTANDREWQQAVRAQQVNLARDVAYLRSASMAAQSAAASND